MYAQKEIVEVDNSYFNGIENWLACEFKELKNGDIFRLRNMTQDLDEYLEKFKCISDCIYDVHLGWHCEIL